MTDRVVVGWDGTTAARAALDWALRHDPRCGAIELVVADSRSGGPSAAASAEVAAERVGTERPDLTVVVTVQHGSAATVLMARSGPDALVVLGGADPGTGRHRSSVAYRVAATAGGPVAMIPEGFDHGRDVVLAVGTAPSAAAVALAAAEHAEQRGQRLVAVHAWRGFLDLDAMTDLDPHRDAIVAKQRDAVLTAALAPVAEHYPSLTTVRKVVHGRAVDAVLGASSRASLLVIGRDETGAARRGRPVAHTAMLSSRVPVLLVPRAAAA